MTATTRIQCIVVRTHVALTVDRRLFADKVLREGRATQADSQGTLTTRGHCADQEAPAQDGGYQP